MKKARQIGILAVIVTIAIWGISLSDKGKGTEAKAADLTLAVSAAVLLDSQTGEWLYEEQANQPLPPASMSKMMTELLVLDAWKRGDIAWDDHVTVSAYASQVGGANMQLEEGQRISVQQLFEAMAVHSANDAAVALAEHVAGSERQFVRLMNDKAKRIGLSDKSHFANATGLPKKHLFPFSEAANETETKMTAKDVALLADYLIRQYPEVLTFTKLASATSAAGENLRTTNEMLPYQRFGTKGNEGIKTGYTEQAGYCFAGSTVIDGRRYISVVMGTKTPEARFEETKKLLQFGTSQQAQGRN